MNDCNDLNWAYLGHMIGNLHNDKELLPVIIEFRNGKRFTAYSFSERDDEIVILVREEDDHPR